MSALLIGRILAIRAEGAQPSALVGLAGGERFQIPLAWLTQDLWYPPRVGELLEIRLKFHQARLDATDGYSRTVPR